MLPRFARRLKRAIRQPAETLGRGGAGSDPGDVVAEGFHEGGGGVGVGVLELDGVGDELGMLEVDWIESWGWRW